MTVSGGIYFLGRYRPAYFEGATVRECARAMMAAARQITDDDMRAWVMCRIYELEGKLGPDPNCSAISSDHCDRGVSFARRPHDRFLDQVTATMPPCPGLDYSAAINAAPDFEDLGGGSFRLGCFRLDPVSKPGG